MNDRVSVPGLAMGLALALGLSGPAYTCGFHGLHNTSELLGIWPALIDRHLVEPNTRVELLQT